MPFAGCLRGGSRCQAAQAEAPPLEVSTSLAHGSQTDMGTRYSKRIFHKQSLSMKMTNEYLFSILQVAGEAADTQQVLQSSKQVLQLYRIPGLSASQSESLLRKASKKLRGDLESIETELCFNVGLSAPLSQAEAETLAWLLRETFEPKQLRGDSWLSSNSSTETVVEVRKSSVSSIKATIPRFFIPVFAVLAGQLANHLSQSFAILQKESCISLLAKLLLLL